MQLTAKMSPLSRRKAKLCYLNRKLKKVNVQINFDSIVYLHLNLLDFFREPRTECG